jgi:hypothetical protein
MNNSRSNVYRGDFRKSVKACEFTHVSVFMRTRRADSHFAASRILCRFQAGNAGTSDLVGMPAMRDLGSLHCSIILLTNESGDLNKPPDCILKKTLIRRRETIYAKSFGGYSSWSFSSA